MWFCTTANLFPADISWSDPSRQKNILQRVLSHIYHWLWSLFIETVFNISCKIVTSSTYCNIDFTEQWANAFIGILKIKSTVHFGYYLWSTKISVLCYCHCIFFWIFIYPSILFALGYMNLVNHIVKMPSCIYASVVYYTIHTCSLQLLEARICLSCSLKLQLNCASSKRNPRTIPSPPPNSTKTSNVPPEDANYTQQPPIRKVRVIGHRFAFKTENDNVEKKPNVQDMKTVGFALTGGFLCFRWPKYVNRKNDCLARRE